MVRYSLIRFCKKSATLSVVLFFTFCSTVLAQPFGIKFYPTGGVAFRTGIMNFFNFKYKWPQSFIRPYHPEKNVHGISLCPGLMMEAGHFQLEYFAGLRHDVLYEIQGVDNAYFRDFILDHHINISLSIRKFSYGVGTSIINVGKSFTYNTNIYNPKYIHESLEFKTVNFFVTLPVWKILNLETKAIYMPNGYPYNRHKKYIMYSIRLFYKFRFLSKKRE